jgi:hypothetical protein
MEVQENNPIPVQENNTTMADDQEKSTSTSANVYSDNGLTQLHETSYVNRTAQNEDFERELERIDEALGLNTTRTEQPHMTIERVAQLTSALGESVQEPQVNIAGSTSLDTILFTPTLEELTTCEIVVKLPEPEKVSGAKAYNKITKWKKRARQTPTVIDSHTMSTISGSITTTTGCEESVEVIEEPLTKRRNTNTSKTDRSLQISAEAAEQPRREL